MISKCNFTRLIFIVLSGFFLSCSQPRQEAKQETGNEYLVTAYIWPSCHHDERLGDMLWPEGGYLLPDIKYGLGHLEAVKKVVKENYNPY
jgi:hypothetical protein